MMCGLLKARRRAMRLVVEVEKRLRSYSPNLMYSPNLRLVKSRLLDSKPLGLRPMMMCERLMTHRMGSFEVESISIDSRHRGREPN
jgi:hypothetical protein